MTKYPGNENDNLDNDPFHSTTERPIKMPDTEQNNTRVVEPQPLSIPQLSRQNVKLGANYIALYIANSQQPLILELSQDTILGRHTAEQTLKPRVDLAPFDAVEKGVSRLHALIRRTPAGLEVSDLASSNGTKLNDTKLEPYLPVSLKSGDHIKLGNLEIEIRFDS